MKRLDIDQGTDKILTVQRSMYIVADGLIPKGKEFSYERL